MMHDNVEIVRHFFEMWREGGWRHLELLATDVVYLPVAEMPLAGEYHGRAGFRRYVEDFFEGDWSTGVHLVGVTYRSYGEKVVTRVEFTGAGRSSGLSMLGRAFQVFTLRDGEIVRIEDFLDRDAALAAAGG